MPTTNDAFFDVLLQIADDHLILGHRLSEWCGHAPTLEEDLSLPNMALDLIGVARTLYTQAAELENKGRDEDGLAYLRTDREYKNCLLVERPNTDFAYTLLRQFYFAAFMKPFWQATQSSANETLSALAVKSEKEISYHLRHCGEWIIRLGQGTEESAERMKNAVESLHPYAPELFIDDAHRELCIESGLIPRASDLNEEWISIVQSLFQQAALAYPSQTQSQTGGRSGLHTESFGHLLAELQYMQRTYPGLSW